MNKPPNYKILLADDHVIIRSGLELLITSIDSAITIYHASNKKELFFELNSQSIDLLILDLNFKDGNSLTWIQEIKTTYPTLKIIVFTSFDEGIYKKRVLSLGVNAFVSKLSMPDEIKSTIETIMFEKSSIPIELQPEGMSILNTLSKREMEIALLLVKGYGNLEISNELNIKSNTISTYKLRIQEKLKLTSLIELIEFFKINQ